MKIICDSCGAKYTVSDEKVRGKTVKVKCRKCSAVIVVSSTGEVSTTGGQTSVPPTASAEAGATFSYTVAVADGDQRTMTMDEVVNAYNEGYIDAETFVWAEGMDDWLPLRDVDPIVDALHEAAAQSGAGAAAAEQEEELGATVAMPDGVPPEVAAAPPVGSDVAVAQSPFGSAMAASASSGAGYGASPAYGSMPAFASSSAPDMGGGLNQIPVNPDAKAGFSSGPGEENSAIFSLNMLTAKVGDGEVAPSPSFSDEEDSGLIDLKALAAGISSDSALASPLDVAGGGGVFPLGAPAPVTPPAPVTVDAGQPASGTNKMMLAGLASVVVVLGAVVVFMLVKGEGPPPAGSAEPAVQTVVVTVTKTLDAPVATAAPTASASASASAKAVARGPRGRGKAPKSTGGGKTPSKGSTPAAPARGKCGCDPNDLMCNMRCAQK